MKVKDMSIADIETYYTLLNKVIDSVNDDIMFFTGRTKENNNLRLRLYEVRRKFDKAINDRISEIEFE